MKHRKIIIGPTDLDNVEEIQDFIDTCDQYEEVDVFLDGNGGYRYLMEVLVKYLNSRKDNINIFLQQYASSCHAILTLLSCENNVFIYPTLEYVVFHVYDTQDFSRRKSGHDYLKYRTTDYTNYLLADKLSVWLPEKKVKKFNQGKDVYLNRTEIQKYFHEKKNIYFL